MAWQYDGLSLQNQRGSNMDGLLLKTRSIHGDPVLLAAVCDGVGSMENGAVASSLTIQMLSEWFDQLEDDLRIGLRLQEFVRSINARIVDVVEQDAIRTASTLSALILSDESFYVVHVGDSRIYSFQNGTMELLTVDHTSENGKLTAFIGKKHNIELFYNEGNADGRRFLLCSDGLYKQMDKEFLKRTVSETTCRNLRKTGEKLAKFVIDRGETDNISLALIMKES